jgi:hypothetical protein
MLNGMPEALMLPLALLMRCAIVASGTRNAWAIWTVVSPATARSVSAIADGGVSAGWQHMKSRRSVSSRSMPISSSSGGTNGSTGERSMAASSSRRRRASSLRR